MRDNTYDPTIGRLLQEARQAKQLSLDNVAEQLRLNRDIIEALENEDYAQLPAPAFVRGYLRAYAGLLGLDSADLLARYQAIAPPDPVLSEVFPGKVVKQNKSPLLPWISAVIVLTLLGLFSVWAVGWYQKHRVDLSGMGSRPTDPPVAEARDSRPIWAPTTSQPATSTPMNDDESLADELEDLEVSEIPSPQTVDANAPTTSIELATPVDPREETLQEMAAERREPADDGITITPVAPRGQDRLVLQASGRSWVNIRDANGHRLIYREVDDADGSVVLQGQAPFDVVLGAAPYVRIRFNGQAFNHSVYTRANQSARFTVRP